MTQEARTMSAALLISRVRRSRQFYRWRPRKVELLLADLATAIDRATPIFPLGAVQLERAILRDSYSRVTTIEMILAELHAITADTYRDYIDDPDRRDASRIICDFIDMDFPRKSGGLF